jgi:hypothetical protein
MSQGDINIKEEEFSTIYHKLALLSSEIETQLLQISGNTDEIEKSINWIRHESYKDPSPEIDFTTRLFRRYVDESNAHRLRLQLSRLDDSDSISLTSEVPDYLYSGTPDQIVGQDAFKRNIFWFRVLSALFTFIAFIIMACVPLIHHRQVTSRMLYSV